MIKYIQKKTLNSKFDYIICADAKNLIFLNNDIILQKQIININDAGLLINLNISILLNSSEKKSQT